MNRRPPRALPRATALAALIALSAFLAGCGGAPADSRPGGIVLISIDALGAKHVGAYGYDRPTTPHLDALASEGALFERVYTPQVYTLTSHISMMSGLYVKTHGASPLRPARPGATMLAELLSRRGFATAAFVSAGGYMKPEFGLGRGFDLYVHGHEAALDEGGRELRRWLERRAQAREIDPGHRFFLFLHFYDVHSDEGTELPYAAPARFRRQLFPAGLDWERRGDTRLLMGMQASGNHDARDREVLRGLYDAEVMHADELRLAPVLALLDQLGLADDTLVVVTSDHGEELLEHGMVTHQQPYEEVARVPLVMRGPGVPRGVRSGGWAELVDLMPTILDAVGLETPAHVQGESLLPLLDGADASSEGAFVDGMMDGLERHPSARGRDVDGVPWTWIGTIDDSEDAGVRSYSATGPGELYRLDRDPAQSQDLAAAQPEIAAALRGELLDWYARNEAAGRALGERETDASLLSDAERERLRALGYSE